MRNFHELVVWVKAHQFTLNVYALSQNFPGKELYGITKQIRRAASSIPTNIAEGCGRRGNPEFAHFLEIALGSANEAEYQLLLSKDLGYLKEIEWGHLTADLREIQKMLISFIQKIRPLPNDSIRQG